MQSRPHLSDPKSKHTAPCSYSAVLLTVSLLLRDAPDIRGAGAQYKA